MVSYQCLSFLCFLKGANRASSPAPLMSRHCCSK